MAALEVDRVALLLNCELAVWAVDLVGSERKPKAYLAQQGFIFGAYQYK